MTTQPPDPDAAPDLDAVIEAALIRVLRRTTGHTSDGRVVRFRTHSHEVM